MKLVESSHYMLIADCVYHFLKLPILLAGKDLHIVEQSCEELYVTVQWNVVSEESKRNGITSYREENN